MTVFTIKLTFFSIQKSQISNNSTIQYYHISYMTYEGNIPMYIFRSWRPSALHIVNMCLEQLHPCQTTHIHYQYYTQSKPWDTQFVLNTSSSAVAKRPCDASCLSVVSFNSKKRGAESFIVSYVGYRFITACCDKCCSVLFGITSCHKHFVLPSTNSAAYYQR